MQGIEGRGQAPWGLLTRSGFNDPGQLAAQGGGGLPLEAGREQAFLSQVVLHYQEGVGGGGAEALDESGAAALAGVDDGFRGDAIDGDNVGSIDGDGGEGGAGVLEGSGLDFGL